ncbi:type II toxin-antitoxin system VapC family toxin [Sphingomonas sp.]|jgi:PIN domain nuclease of toxin-antitoxin system|uniref:type II toxin-antitoxin system VapC family toxin n=1 Tax=Sphingomonas sp. TaxID=28214 RepID=UPI002ED9EA64
MRLLLDTHYVIWFANNTAMMTQSERLAISDASSVHVSAVSLWEIRIKWQTRDRHGRRKGTLDPAAALSFIRANSFQLVPLLGEDSIFALSPPIDHRDPFDEMLLVHAGRIGGRLLTRDEKLRDHPLALSV